MSWITWLSNTGKEQSKVKDANTKYEIQIQNIKAKYENKNTKIQNTSTRRRFHGSPGFTTHVHGNNTIYKKLNTKYKLINTKYRGSDGPLHGNELCQRG